MRDLPRLPQNASAEEKIRIIYDWLYELQLVMINLKERKNEEQNA